VYVFNNSLPGPVLHVYQNQTVRVRIFNDFTTESLSVHFHGIRQVNTPESDGIGRVTQLSILPGSSFLHEFVAVDTGTFWYHSHVHSQTAMGLMGGFIVHPKTASNKEEQGEFVLLLNDWQHFYTSEQHHLLIESGQFYPNDLESLTQSGTIDFFEAVDGSRAAEALVTSILINGRGRYIDPRNGTNGSSTTPLEYLKIVSVQANSTYRLRLINGGSVFSLKFSIDNHPLKVIASDGVPFAQPVIVDQVIIGLGERYDVIISNLTTINNNINYWIRVDTMDKNNNTRWHALAILQYATTNEMPTTKPQDCTVLQPCRILNCPFSQYGPSDINNRTPFICLTPLNMSTHNDHLDHDLLNETIPINIKQTLQFTMVEGQDDQPGFESFNYIGMKYPSMTEPILQNPRLARELSPCPNQSLDVDSGKKCYHTIVAQYNDIIEFLLVNHDDDQHPIHLHGSYFHIVEQGLAQLNTTTGEFIDHNPNVECDEHALCVCKQNNSMCTTNNMRLVKDTVQLPKGG
jgi:FtsP/CotA-like multicopper oxidase with cupredoxin domain